MTKYRAIPTMVNGTRFASKREAKRYNELKLLQRLGEISGLTLQYPYEISINGVKCFKYIADFVYQDKGKIVCEDVKGFKTDVYKLKKRIVEASYGIKIVEV